MSASYILQLAEGRLSTLFRMPLVTTALIQFPFFSSFLLGVHGKHCVHKYHLDALRKHLISISNGHMCLHETKTTALRGDSTALSGFFVVGCSFSLILSGEAFLVITTRMGINYCIRFLFMFSHLFFLFLRLPNVERERRIGNHERGYLLIITKWAVNVASGKMVLEQIFQEDDVHVLFVHFFFWGGVSFTSSGRGRWCGGQAPDR